MSDGVSGGDGSGHQEAGAPSHLSMLLEELARAPGDDLHRAWQQRLQPGETVGRFEILQEIGRGGFGVVYEAFDRQLGRSVAFKTLRPGRTGHQLSADWILREAEAVARLDHPAIVTLYDVGRCDSGPYLVEELLRGETLEQRLRAGPLPAREVVAIGLEVARGLAHAHGRGVWHRDLKPGNVLLTEDGRVKLLDFGLAHLLGTRGLPGTGTPAYMAPEQLRGEETDARADVFALGATMFEALTGQVPFEVKDGRSAALDPGPQPVLPGGTPSALAALVGRCLSRDPGMRPANGRALAEDLLVLQQALDRAGLEGREATAGARASPRSLRLALLVAGVAAVAAAGGAYLVAGRSRSASHAVWPATSPPALPSVAVLPFADMSPGRDQEYFADGVAEEILNTLAQVEGLHVTGRTSSFSFRGKQAELGEIGRRLKVATVLEGSVRRSGTRVRIAAKLVNTSDGFYLWSRTFDRELTDVFAVQEEIARDVVEALKVKLLPGRAPSTRWSRTANPEVYNQYLLGQEFIRRGTLADFRRALAAYERALALEPAYAPAWAGLSLAFYWNEGLGEAGPASRDRASSTAERAIALAPDLADAYLARGLVRRDFAFDWDGARADLERALALSPAHAQSMHEYAFLVAILGKLQEALALARKATEFDPLDPEAWVVLGAVFHLAGESESARDALNRALEISAEHTNALVTLCSVLVVTGRANDAIALAGRSHVEWLRLHCTALAERDLGGLASSRAALDALVAGHARTAAYQIAENFAWRGEPDRAFEWLERAYTQRDSGLPFAKNDPILRTLHGDRRWKPFLRKMNLPVD